MKQLGEPYCGACGYALKGAVESSVCPECGKPLVEVLERRQTTNSNGYKRYRSEKTLFGHPLVDVAFGADPGERLGHARGIIAIGEDAVGFIAIGLFARGFVAIGTVGFGVISMAALGIGVAAMGGFAAGAVASFGGMSVSGYYAFGGMAAGHTGMGGLWHQLW
jgi:predicted RNA-binding Zn-ribbon protein involved in translation (DUF1610 family)